MKISPLKTILICTTALALTGCEQQLPMFKTVLPSDPVNINTNSSFFPMATSDANQPPPPNLNDMTALMAPDTSVSNKDRAKELLFLPAMRDAAFAYGVAGGLAYSTNIINATLKADAESLSKTYDFSRIVTMEPGGGMILPPVISQEKDTYQEGDFGRSIRVADTTYDIIQEAQFAPTAPLWFSYLYKPYQNPTPPDPSTLPKTADESASWAHYVKEGWAMGVQQGVMNLKLDLALLNQNFVGMIRYRTLYDEGKVSAPVIDNQYLGTTGTGNTMREGDRVEKIIQEPRLNVPDQAPPDGEAKASN